MIPSNLKDEVYEHLKDLMNEKIANVILYPRKHGKSWLQSYGDIESYIHFKKEEKTEIEKTFDDLMNDIAG